MAWRNGTMLKSTAENLLCRLGLRRWTHSFAQPPPLNGSMGPPTMSLPMVLPETGLTLENNLRVERPNLYFGGSMELMAVPKKKVSRHKRGIRNGPKALKPIPVIIRCRACGRVKLPHFYCCGGRKTTE